MFIVILFIFLGILSGVLCHHDGHHLAHSLADRGSALYRSEHLSWFCGRLHRALPRQLVVYGLI